ncbi:MAG: DoxX family protein [Akkermansia muciniphila]
MLTEFFAPICLVLGIFTRLAALSVIIMMAVAMTKHVKNGYFANWSGEKKRGRGGIPPALCRLRPGAASDRSRPVVRGCLVHGYHARHLRLTEAGHTLPGIGRTFRFSNPLYSGIYGKAFFCLVNPSRHDQP